MAKPLKRVKKLTEKAKTANSVEDSTINPVSNAVGTGGKVPVQGSSKGKAMENADSKANSLAKKSREELLEKIPEGSD